MRVHETMSRKRRGTAALMITMGVMVSVGGCASGNDQPEPATSAPEPASPAASSAALPPAADGSNLEACADGECQVKVTAPAEFTVQDIQIAVTVQGDRVRIRQTDGHGSTSQITVSGANGTSSIGTDDGQLTVRIDGASGNEVVLDISSS